MGARGGDIETVGLGIPYEGWLPGRRLRTIGRTVTEADITGFINATGMLEVLFTDSEYLATSGMFARRPAPGIMVQAFAESLLLQYTLQHTGLAFLGGETIVKGPCFAGDTIHVVSQVVSARRTSKPGRGIVVTRNEVVNQHGRVVLEYTATRMVKASDTKEEEGNDGRGNA